MELDEIIKIIEALSKGYIYGTGEIVLLSEEYSKENDALEIALGILKKEKNKIAKRNNKPARNGQPWIEKEENSLCITFDELQKNGLNNKVIISKLANKHQRTNGAILSRLQRNNKIPLDFHL